MGKLKKRNSVTFIFIGLIIINICANYVSGSTGVYASVAFREYERIDLFSIMFIVEPLARSVSLLVSGSAGESFGRKRLYLWSVGAYAVSILLCALSTNGYLFLIAQSASGFFLGLFFSNVFAILNDVVPEEEYPVRVGTLQTVNFVVLILGPIVCGFFTEQWSWRVSLFALLPLFIIGLLLVAYFMPVRKTHEHHTDKFTNRNLLSELQIRVLLKNKGFLIISMLTFIFTCITCSGKYIPLYAQMVLNSSPTISAAILTPCNLIAVCLCAGISKRRFDCKRNCVYRFYSGNSFYFRGSCIYNCIRKKCCFFTSYNFFLWRLSLNYNYS